MGPFLTTKVKVSIEVFRNYLATSWTNFTDVRRFEALKGMVKIWHHIIAKLTKNPIFKGEIVSNMGHQKSLSSSLGSSDFENFAIWKIWNAPK